ncbi:uncharacterized protein ColSpa_08876 [Colletotrichum spaethianum]|uniref:Uncharacterized protein n=1 Tax=Colletotrichum spaethianum TaxID=700344 RepID=A0AA37PAI6_9PEZI|nr:uncharacterized protein ColSpa_08876 [Colletotrichum spaethianum]GKT48695.1 hypothetical protein ColSpa_08876 [Colletotrichum spaethianum]
MHACFEAADHVHKWFELSTNDLPTFQATGFDAVDLAVAGKRGLGARVGEPKQAQHGVELLDTAPRPPEIDNSLCLVSLIDGAVYQYNS